MSTILLVKNVDTSEPPEVEALNPVKQEIDEMVDVRNEPMLKESKPNEFYNEESKYIKDQILDKNEKVSPKEDFLTTWNSHYIKTEISEDFNVGTDSTVHIFSKLGVKNDLNETKMGEEMQDSNLIRDKNNHMQYENTECTMIKIEEANKMSCSMQLELTQKCNLLPSKDSIISVETETSEDFNDKGENKYMINQIVDENDKVWLKEDCLTSWNFQSVKIEKSEHFNSETECTKSKENDVNAVPSSIQMEPSPPKCDMPKNLESIHSKKGNHKCHLCDYSSSWRGALQTHIKSVHLKLKDNECNYCDYSSSRQADLQMHIKSVHLKLKKYKCHLCHHSSAQATNLQQHIKSVHLKLKNHKCNLCDYSSSQATNLQQHIKSIHLKLKNHKCNLCDYSSTWKGHLQQHTKSVHLKLKNHKCNLCDYSSSHATNLQRHVKSIHLKHKNLKCNLCDYSSQQKKDLDSHIKSAHL